ncbi:MAG TPA: ABC transporter ATP-binding protein, partial [Bacteroidetes bacterium]|nr:ABC transporter ATP-binding protein [Bacteroidota bacterium]
TLRGKKIGFIFQQFNLIPYLTAIENITLPMLFQSKSKRERIKRGRELLKIVELEDREKHKPNELSGGQQQRVAIARALANDPEIILADEPTGNLDTKTGSTILDFLKTLNKKFNKTIVIVTHDRKIGSGCQRQVFIKDGQIVNAL